MVEMGTRSENASPITDRDEAQRFDLSSRMLRVILLISGIYWLFIAALLNVSARLHWRQPYSSHSWASSIRWASSGTSPACTARGSRNSPIR